MSLNNLKIVTAAVADPVTVAVAKSHLKITHSFEDDDVQRLIKSATSWAQDETKRIIMSTVVDLSLHDFPFRFFGLPGGKVTAVEKVDYIDDEGNPQTLSGATSDTPGTDYQEDLTDDERAFLYPAIDDFWPSVQSGTINVLTVQFTVGYGVKPEDVPESITQAILFKIGDMYTARDSEDAKGKSAAVTAAENLLHAHVLQAA